MIRFLLVSLIALAPVAGFDQDKVVASFGVLSDVHIEGARNTPSQKFQKALQQLCAKAEECDADGLDGVLVAGDLINNAYASESNYVQMYYFKSVYESVLDPVKVPLVYAPGNHDTFKEWTPAATSQAKNMASWLGEKYFLTDVDKDALEEFECRHCVVNGYDVLTMEPISRNPVTYTAGAKDWLDKTLAEITSKNPDRYVLILTHPMIANTVYGSTLGDYWETDDLTPILAKYPQAVTFSGHLHFPLNDPRSVWQGDFTAFGCGSVRYMAIEDGKFENMRSKTVMKDADEFSQGLLVQFDASGNMRATRMDFYNGTTIGEAWTVDAPRADKSHLQKYSHALRSAANTAPSIGGFDIVKGVMAKDGLPVSIGFNSGKDDEFVHHYDIDVKCADTLVCHKSILADFYRTGDPSQMRSRWVQSFGKLLPGDYEISLTAVDSWGARSKTITEKLPVPKSAVKVDIPLEHDWLFYGDAPCRLDVAYSGEKGARATLGVTLVRDLSLMESVKDTAVTMSRKVTAASKERRTTFNLGHLDPGFYEVMVSIDGIDDQRFNIGVNPEQIQSPQDKKDDFDEFWTATLDSLARIPIDAEFFLDKEHSDEHRSTFRVTMRSFGGEQIGGILCIPNKPGKYVTYIDYMGYGADPYYYNPARDPDVIEFLVSVRDQGIFKRKGHYRWIDRGLDSKENFYYRGAFCDVVRAIDFISSIEKVDMDRLYARGESQGGGFTLISVSLDHRIKACAPSVPFLGDYRDYSRIVSWPMWEVIEQCDRDGISRESLFDMLTYFDVKNFTDRIQCPVFMAFGLQDPTCPPHTNFSGYNQITSEKRYYCSPKCGHAMWADEKWNKLYREFFKEMISR